MSCTFKSSNFFVLGEVYALVLWEPPVPSNDIVPLLCYGLETTSCEDSSYLPKIFLFLFIWSSIFLIMLLKSLATYFLSGSCMKMLYGIIKVLLLSLLLSLFNSEAAIFCFLINSGSSGSVMSSIPKISYPPKEAIFYCDSDFSLLCLR